MRLNEETRRIVVKTLEGFIYALGIWAALVAVGVIAILTCGIIFAPLMNWALKQ